MTIVYMYRYTSMHSFSLLDLGLAKDPLPTKRKFVPSDVLTLQYISHKLRHVSPPGVVALLCSSSITYVTLLIVKHPLVQILNDCLYLYVNEVYIKCCLLKLNSKYPSLTYISLCLNIKHVFWLD